MKELNNLDFRIKQIEFILKNLPQFDIWLIRHKKRKVLINILNSLNKRYDNILSDLWNKGIFI